MDIKKRLSLLEQQQQKAEPDVFIRQYMDVNHCTGVLVGYRLRNEADGEIVQRLPGEPPEALQERAVARYKKIYLNSIIIFMTEVYDEEKGFCIPVKAV